MSAIREALATDLNDMVNEARISQQEADLYAQVFPIVRPSYVSYARPKITTHEDVFRLIQQSGGL